MMWLALVFPTLLVWAYLFGWRFVGRPLTGESRASAWLFDLIGRPAIALRRRAASRRNDVAGAPESPISL